MNSRLVKLESDALTARRFDPGPKARSLLAMLSRGSQFGHQDMDDLCRLYR